MRWFSSVLFPPNTSAGVGIYELKGIIERSVVNAARGAAGPGRTLDAAAQCAIIWTFFQLIRKGRRGVGGISVVMLDFGGVYAEEGFREGLKAIAAKCGLDPEGFFETVRDLVYSCGYTTGRIDEAGFWDLVRSETPVTMDDAELREEILSRFRVRPEMTGFVESARSRGFVTAMLTDQTNWVEELEAEEPFFHLFDHVFNSYRIHLSKRSTGVFPFVCSKMGVAPGEVLFVDDSAGHIERAGKMGLVTILYRDFDTFREEAEAALEERGDRTAER